MKERLTNLNGEQNDTGNLLVSHRICHFRAIQPFDSLSSKPKGLHQRNKCLQTYTKCADSDHPAQYYPDLYSPFIHSVVFNDSVSRH